MKQLIVQAPAFDVVLLFRPEVLLVQKLVVEVVDAL
jgi:hypothetical protein